MVLCDRFGFVINHRFHRIQNFHGVDGIRPLRERHQNLCELLERNLVLLLLGVRRDGETVEKTSETLGDGLEDLLDFFEGEV